MNPFWGLIMEPSKRYSQVIKTPFHISQAALDLNTADSNPVQVIVCVDGRNYLICTLVKDKIIQVTLDLNFDAGNTVGFTTVGNGTVHLTGYMIDDEESDGEFEEEEIENVKLGKRKSPTSSSPPKKKTKTQILLEKYNEDYRESDDSNYIEEMIDSDDDEVFNNEDSSDDDDNEAIMEEEDNDSNDYADSDDEDDDDDEEDDEEEIEEPKSKKQQKNLKQNGVTKMKNKETASSQSPKENLNKKQKEKPAKGTGGNTPQKKVLDGGVQIEDLVVGQGPIAKQGSQLRVYYEGRLKSNNQMFDSATKGTGFKFRLGRQEVIKGWDIGVNGMKVGGKRRIVCPPRMAYGAAGSPPVIPPNSTLIFDIELKQVN